MREFTLTVFDESINGTGPWYTSELFHDVLGSADTFMLQGVTQSVSGTTILGVDVQHSCNGLDWLTLETALSGTAVNDGNFQFTHAGLFVTPTLSLVRLKISLSGTTPGCRLHLSMCGRTARAPTGTK